MARTRALPDEVGDELVAHARVIEVSRGCALFRRRDAGPGLCVVARGQLQVCLLSSRGRELLLYLAGPDRLITEGYDADGGPCAAHAIARADSQVWIVPTAAVRAASECSPAFATALIHCLAVRRDRYIERISWLSLLPVEGRLAAFLLATARRLRRAPGRACVIPRSLDMQTVAALIGSTREEVTRVQRRLHSAGIIQVERNHIHLLDIGALGRLMELTDAGASSSGGVTS